MKESYYQENCNSGAIDEHMNLCLPCAPTPTRSPTDEAIDTNALIIKIKNAFKNIESSGFKNPHHHYQNDDSNETNNVKKQATTTHNIATINSKLYQEMEQSVINAVASGQSAEDNLRHAQQDFYIILQMLKVGLISYTNDDQQIEIINNSDSPNDTTNTVPRPLPSQHQVFIELGAGKGMLGLAMHAVIPKSTIVLVERSGAKRKADKILRTRQGDFYRARMDIRHCLISQLPGISHVSYWYLLIIHLFVFCMLYVCLFGWLDVCIYMFILFVSCLYACMYVNSLVPMLVS
jgi:hypothetical protein